MKKMIRSEKRKANLAFDIFKYLYEKDKFSALAPYIKYSEPKTGEGGEKILRLESSGEKKLVGLFLKATEKSIEERNSRRAPRWFTTPFVYDDEQIFLSTQWNWSGDFQLTMEKLDFFLKKCHTGSEGSLYHIEKIGDEYCFVETDEVEEGNVRFVDELSTDEFDDEEEFAKRNSSLEVCLPGMKIFFGAPGTGKSHRIDAPEAEGGLGLKSIPSTRKFRTTFHPDYDYAQFVGSYKPVKLKDKVGNPILVGGVPQIGYEFVPQVFAKAYIAAWKEYLKAKENPAPVYVVVEEINRGNCAQIFGDIFQLLDRKAGWSEYPIDVDHDFAEYIRTKMGDDFDAYCAEIRSRMEESIDEDDFDFNKIILPCNLNILATMNTSDQSLFPMDSAFKRRFDWEYVPIDFEGKDCADYQIEIGGEKPFSWQKFVESVNEKIFNITDSEDKQLGEYFIKLNPADNNIITKERFLGKVMFYLWNEICKDVHKQDSFFREEENGNYFTFQDLYKTDGDKKLISFMNWITK